MKTRPKVTPARMKTEPLAPAQSPAAEPDSAPHLGRRPALDGLRGLAVLAVTACHFDLPFSSRGNLGVDIFFALSGFLITTILAEEWSRNRSIHLGKFYLRRILRLYPALLLMLLVVGQITTNRAYIFSSLTYLTNWMIALHFQPLNLELGHTWTLAIEEQYYLFWPLLLLFLLHRLPPKRVVLVPLCLAIFSVLWRLWVWNTIGDEWRWNAGTDTHADGLFLGSALGLAFVFDFLPSGERFKRGLTITTWVMIGLIFLVIVAFPQPVGFFANIGALGVVVTTLLVILRVVVYPSRGLKAVLEFKPLVFAGLISYGLYLWQVPILVLVDLQKLGWSYPVAAFTKFLLILAVTLLSYRYLEKPLLRLKPSSVSRNRSFQPAGHMEDQASGGM
jgi:peptidoglycan/LPS O-acetylase OafA/YrhL